MTRRLLLDIFSPLPPLATDIANFTAGLLEPLQALAQVRVWTAQSGPVDVPVPGVELRRFSPGETSWTELNAADATFYNIGNNARFHQAIHRVARRAPSIVILHDTRLQNFFAAYSERSGEDRAYYLDQLEAAYGVGARRLCEDYIAGRSGLDELIRIAPMTLPALDGAVGAIMHNQGDAACCAEQTDVPIYYLPLSFRYGPAPKRKRTFEPNAPTRLVMFGFIGRNRRLPEILSTLAAMPDRDRYRLDV